MRQHTCVTCHQPIPEGHLFAYEDQAYCAVHAPRGSERWHEASGEWQGSGTASGDIQRVELVGVEIPFDQLFRLVSKIMFVIVLLGLVATGLGYACYAVLDTLKQ